MIENKEENNFKKNVPRSYDPNSGRYHYPYLHECDTKKNYIEVLLRFDYQSGIQLTLKKVSK